MALGTACTENSLPWVLEKSRVMKKSLLFLFVCAVFSLSAQSEQRTEVIQANAVQSTEDLSVAENTTKPVQAKKASCCSKKSNASSCSSSKSAKVETASTEPRPRQQLFSPRQKKAEQRQQQIRLQQFSHCSGALKTERKRKFWYTTVGWGRFPSDA